MKKATAIALGLFVFPAFSQFPVQRPTETEILQAKGVAAKVIIEKAYSILFQAQVFASRAIGDGAAPTSSCWAMTVIVKHDPEALPRLTRSLSFMEVPEPKLYALAAMFSVDPKTAERWPLSSFPQPIGSEWFTRWTVVSTVKPPLRVFWRRFIIRELADTFLTTFHPSIRQPTLHVMRTRPSSPAHPYTRSGTGFAKVSLTTAGE